jgi:hypothetical protein
VDMKDTCQCGLLTSEYTAVNGWDESGKRIIIKIKKEALEKLRIDMSNNEDSDQHLKEVLENKKSQLRIVRKQRKRRLGISHNWFDFYREEHMKELEKEIQNLKALLKK